MTENSSTSTEVINKKHFDIVIIGGGIAGLYCALMYKGNKSIALFEKTKRVGGRIWTESFPGENGPEFLAEFGPMRIQPQQQERLSKLLDMLNIRDRKGPPPEAHDARPAIYLNDFPAYASPPEIEGPIYKLTGDESEQASAIDLLQLAFVRVLGRLTVDPSSPEVERRALDARLKSGREQLMLALATRQKTWKGAFERWVGSLKEEDYQLLRAHALFEVDKDNSYPLWLMGFWNLIAEVLSHEAITKLRVQGHFGHTIEENPNAAEWLIGWLRGLKSSRGLKGTLQRGGQVLAAIGGSVPVLDADDVEDLEDAPENEVEAAEEQILIRRQRRAAWPSCAPKSRP